MVEARAFSVWSGALATAGAWSSTGPWKAPEGRRRPRRRELYRFKTPSGIVGNVTTYMADGRQYVAVLSGIGGWAESASRRA